MEFAGKKVLILGGGVTGSSVAKIIEELGAKVAIADEKPVADYVAHPINEIENLNYDFAIVSPGWKPDHQLIQALVNKGITITNEIDLAWHFRNLHAPKQKWVAITGTNGKTTTTLMLESILQASGRRAVAAGNIGVSLVETLMHPEPWDVLAVEVGAPQLPFVHSMSPQAAVVAPPSGRARSPEVAVTLTKRPPRYVPPKVLTAISESGDRPSPESLQAAVRFTFQTVLLREPNDEELQRFARFCLVRDRAFWQSPRPRTRQRSGTRRPGAGSGQRTGLPPPRSTGPSGGPGRHPGPAPRGPASAPGRPTLTPSTADGADRRTTSRAWPRPRRWR